VEALLALTNIAELCAQQTYYQHSQAQTSAVAAAAQAAAAAAKGPSSSSGSSPSPFYSFGSSTNAPASTPAPPTYPYPSLVAPAPGSVPFPPLSFSQTLSAEAVAAFDASLTSTIQNGSVLDRANKGSISSFSLPPAPLFPSSSSSSYQSSALTPPTGGINFTSLAPPPGGAHNPVPSNAFLPPPTPVPGKSGGALASFPQQLSASSQHLLLRHADAIPTLISLLSSPNREVYEQAMWILGSIAVGDSPGTSSSGGSSSSSTLDGARDKSVSARDVILAAGVMNQLLRCLESHPTNLSLQRIGSWTLSNLVEGIFQQASHGKNSKSSDYSSSDEIEMTTLLPVLRRLLRMSDSEVLSYTCWTLSHLCDGPSSHIAGVVTTKSSSKAPKGGLVPRLVELLIHPSWRVTKPALRTIGNIVCAECSDDINNGSTTDYTEVILECEAVPRLKELVTHNNREIQKEACWTLSNIAAGTVDQIQAVIDSGAIPPLVKLVRDKKTDQEVRSEACWVVLNATSCGSDSQIEILVDEGCVSVLGVLLSEASMVMMALEGLERVLQVEESREMVRREQIENGEIEDDEESRTPTLVSAALIDKARESHNSSAVTKRAERIWKQHFVSCALCKKSSSKHRTADATFCEECKCYVCCNCNCQIYHLSYQEELWAETEEKTAQKKNAKKSKNKKKKEKLKNKKSNNEPEQFVKEVKPAGNRSQGGKDGAAEQSRSSMASTASEVSAEKQSNNEENEVKSPTAPPTTLEESKGSPFNSDPDEDNADDDVVESEDEKQNQQPAIDFVLYLQQTGSIIALAKLMDALEYGEDYDEGLDDTELKLIRQQQMLSRQAST
jgi:hypothetical protein